MRLAINLLRLEGPAAQSWPHAREDAGRQLERLTADPPDDWIASVAAQELARFQRDDPAAAAAVLEAALARRPDDAEIEIQLTYLYDRLQQPEKSRALAAKLGQTGIGGAADAGASPRGRYNQWTSEALAAGRRELQDGARDRLAALRQAASPADQPRVARTGEKEMSRPNHRCSPVPLGFPRTPAAAAVLARARLAAARRGSPPAKPADTFTDQTTTVVVEVPVEVTSEAAPCAAFRPAASSFSTTAGGRRSWRSRWSTSKPWASRTPS